jgi:hypothetical protein
MERKRTAWVYPFSIKSCSVFFKKVRKDQVGFCRE